MTFKKAKQNGEKNILNSSTKILFLIMTMFLINSVYAQNPDPGAVPQDMKTAQPGTAVEPGSDLDPGMKPGEEDPGTPPAGQPPAIQPPAAQPEERGPQATTTGGPSPFVKSEKEAEEDLGAEPAKTSESDPLPPPPVISSSSSSGAEKKANLIFQQAKIELVLQALQTQTGVNVIPRGKVVGQRIDTLYRDQTAKEIVESLAYKYKWVSRKIDDKKFELMDEETYQKEVLPDMTIQKIFKLQNITAADAENALKGIITKNLGSIAKDDRTNKIIVTDIPPVIEQIKRILDQIDVKLITRVFYIKHANIEQIVDKLQNYKSDPGIIDADEKTHQIIVIDTFENVKRMEMIIDVLDVGPEMKIYDINNIGFEGKMVEDLRAMIEKVVTEDSFWDINYKAGTLLVEDVPEVHEKVEKILLAFDRPSKQVYIQAEMVETTMLDTFTYGVQYDASRNLKAAVKDGVYTPWSGTTTKDEEGKTVTTENFPIKSDYGYTDIWKEFPLASVGGSGFAVKYLDEYIKAQFTSMMSDSNTRILTQPRLIVKNQETATIHVGGKKPYVTYYYDNSNSANRSNTSQAEKDYGTKLELNPSISNNGLVELKVKIEQSVAKEVEGKTVGGVVTLIETVNEEASTVLIVPSGETRVIGGLLKNQDAESKSGLPFLYKIPYIGPLLFGSSSQSSDKMNLYFFVTPTVVEEEGIKRKKFSVRAVEEKFPDVIEDDTDTTISEKLQKVLKEKAAGEEGNEGKEKGVDDISSLLESSKDVPEELEKVSIKESKMDNSNYKVRISGPSGSLTTSTPAAPRTPTSTTAQPAPSTPVNQPPQPSQPAQPTRPTTTQTSRPSQSESQAGRINPGTETKY